MAQEPDLVTPDRDDTDDAPPEAARIERDIERTRAEMSETIDAIGARFQPSYIKEQAKDAIRDTARDAGTSMIDRIRDNPLPSAVAALSIGWLLFNGDDSSRRRRGNRRSEYRGYGSPSGGDYRGYGDYGSGYGQGYGAYGRAGYDAPSGGYAGATGGYRAESQETDGPSIGDRATRALHDARDTAGEALGGVRERAADLGEHVSDSARDMQEQAGMASRRAMSWLEDQMDRNPLGVGAVALAAGALVGLSVPSTDAENEMMGRHRDALASRVSEVAGDKFDQVKQVASTVVDEVKEVASTVVGDVKEKAKEVVDHATDEAKNLASNAAAGAAGGAQGGASQGGSTPSGSTASGSTSTPGGSSQGGSASSGGSARPGGEARPAGAPDGEHVANVNAPDADKMGDPA